MYIASCMWRKIISCYTHIHAYIHTYIHTHTCVCVYIHTQTHKKNVYAKSLHSCTYTQNTPPLRNWTCHLHQYTHTYILLNANKHTENKAPKYTAQVHAWDTGAMACKTCWYFEHMLHFCRCETLHTHGISFVVKKCTQGQGRAACLMLKKIE
jgi:hypothetical protein